MITVSIYNLKQLNKFSKYIDCAILNIPDYSLIYEDLDIVKAISFCNRNNIKPIISLNRIIHPKEIVEFENMIIKYIEEDVLFLVTDLGLVNIFIKHNIINKVIFDPQTMITNYQDLYEYSLIGFDSLSMSLEIPLNDVKLSLDKNNCSLFYQVFGHRLMFYSKRKLITLYKEKAQIHSTMKDLYLRESTRKEYLPIIENNNGTVIYRSYLISLLNHIDILNMFKYLYLETLYIDDDIFINILKIYYDVINNNIKLEEGLKLISNLDLDIQDGFTYKDSVYQKELF